MGSGKDLLPMIGPEKGKILQNLVIQREPQVVVEVGSFLGMSLAPLGIHQTVFSLKRFLAGNLPAVRLRRHRTDKYTGTAGAKLGLLYSCCHQDILQS